MKNRFNQNLIYLFLFLFITACDMSSDKSPKTVADMVLLNGKVITVDEAFSVKEAVAIAADTILAVGTTETIKKLVGEHTKVIELAGKTVLPGLIDAHGHISSQGRYIQNLDFNGIKSYQEIVDMVGAKVADVQPGEWILGRGWDQNNWEVKEFPVHDPISALTPNNPVMLIRTDGHALFANAKAMEIAGVNKDTKDPAGGKIVRKNNREPAGVFIDNAQTLIEPFVPADRKVIKERIKIASDDCISKGLVSVHDAGTSLEEISIFKELIDEDQMGIRVYAMFNDPGMEADLEAFFRKNRLEDYKRDMLRATAVKLYKDGALGSRGAFLLEEYSDDPGNFGLEVRTKEHIYNVASAALKTGIQVNTHSIGDAGNRFTLDAYEMALKENPNENHRFRIEHAQIMKLEDIPRFVGLGVLPCMQPASVVSDMDWTEDRVGPERVKGAYVFRTFLKSGSIIAFSSDFPVESNNPFQGIYRAITRQDEQGLPAGGWYGEEKVTIKEAIKGYTIWAAYSSFQEDVLGSIEVGKYADFTIIDRNLLEITPKEVLNTKVEYTIIGGKVRYEGS
jgi:predicted amidohydrolase YtcJ